jgi:hypothetical protein
LPDESDVTLPAGSYCTRPKITGKGVMTMLEFAA